jgi:tetratricopeptide (TPR) repeat protein
VRLEGSIPAPCPITRLRERKLWRAASATRAATLCIAEQNPGSLWRGIDGFALLQIPSSPFETESEQVELDEAVLADLRDAALAEPPSAFVREAWNWLARVLAGKRDVSAIETFIAPLAARWAPWPELEIALARADIEALDPAAAVRRLTPIAEAPEPSFDVLCVLGEAREQAGDSAGAVAVWKRALPLRPNDAWIRRHLAMARVRTGDPGAAEAIREWLDEHPEDEEMRIFLGPGPWPEPAVGPSLDSSARREHESG